MLLLLQQQITLAVYPVFRNMLLTPPQLTQILLMHKYKLQAKLVTMFLGGKCGMYLEQYSTNIRCVCLF